MREKKVTQYECEHCKKKMYRKYSMVLHEKVCFKNPANVRACFGCKHLENANVVAYPNGEWKEEIRKGYYCAKKHINIYTPKAEIILLPKYPDTFEGQEAMPKECEVFEKISLDTTSIFD